MPHAPHHLQGPGGHTHDGHIQEPGAGTVFMWTKTGGCCAECDTHLNSTLFAAVSSPEPWYGSIKIRTPVVCRALEATVCATYGSVCSIGTAIQISCCIIIKFCICVLMLGMGNCMAS